MKKYAVKLIRKNPDIPGALGHHYGSKESILNQNKK